MDILATIQQQQAQDDQARLQRAQLSLQRRQVIEASKDRALKQRLWVADNQAFGPDVRAQSMNEVMGLIGHPEVRVAPETLAPMMSWFKDYIKRQEKGLPTDELEYGLELILKDPRSVPPEMFPQVVEAGQELQERKINKVIAAPSAVQEDRRLLNEAGWMLDIANQNDWADSYQNFANRELEAKRTLDPTASSVDFTEAQYRQAQSMGRTPAGVVTRLRQAQANHLADLSQTEERDRLRSFFRMNPGAIPKAAELQLEEAGLVGDPIKKIEMKVLKTMQKDARERTEEEVRYVNAAASVLPEQTRKSLGLLSTKEWQLQGREDLKNTTGKRTVLDQFLAEDTTGAQAVNELAQKRHDTLTSMEGITKPTDEQAKNWTQQAQEYLAGFQAGEAAYQQTAKKQTAHYATVGAQLEKQKAALQARLLAASPSESANIKTRIEDVKSEVKAHEAAVRLMQEHTPFDIEVLQSSKDSLQLKLKTAEATGNQTEAATLRQRIEQTNATIMQKARGRQDDLQTVTKYQGALLQREAKLGEQMKLVDEKVDKEAVLNWAKIRALNLIGQPDPDKPGKKLSRADAARVAAVESGANVTELGKAVLELDKLDEPGAQIAMNTLIAAWQAQPANKGAWPDHTALMGMAAKVAKKYPGVKREDIIKGLERGSTLRLELPTQIKQHAIEDVQNLDLAQQTIDDLRDIVEKNPTAVGAVGGVQRFMAGMGQQVHDVARSAFAQDKNLDPKAKERLSKMLDTKPADELEALTIGLTYRVARAVSGPGVLANQDVEFAERMVGGLKSASGSVQFMNKLGIIEREMRRRARSARNILSNKGVPAPEGAAPAKDLGQMSIQELMQMITTPPSDGS